MALWQYLGAGASITKGLYHLDSSWADSSGNAFTWNPINCSFWNWAVGSGSVTLNWTNAYVNMGNVMQFDYNTPFTISCILKNEATWGSNIISKQQNWWAYLWYGLWTASNWTLQFFIYAWWTNGSFILNFPSSYNDGKFHQIDCTYDGSNSIAWVHLYVDWQEVSWTVINNFTFSVSIATVSSFQISWRWGAANVAKWAVDDTVIENVVRSSRSVRVNRTYSLGRFATL